jgi:minor extracellular serine protease Vpr
VRRRLPHGAAILNAIEWSLDPNGDGDLSDRADIINLSLGSNFGSPTNPIAVASDNASKAGVVVVASADLAAPARSSST